MCPDYDEEELLQIARNDPHARVMIPRAISMRNETRSRRRESKMDKVLQEGCDNIRNILRLQREHERQEASSQTSELSSKRNMQKR